MTEESLRTAMNQSASTLDRLADSIRGKRVFSALEAAKLVTEIQLEAIRLRSAAFVESEY